MADLVMHPSIAADKIVSPDRLASDVLRRQGAERPDGIAWITPHDDGHLRKPTPRQIASRRVCYRLALRAAIVWLASRATARSVRC